jgi:SAM-dependent methyltransferase
VIGSILRNRLAARFWSRTHASGGLRTWMAEPCVRAYVNKSVSGSPSVWPMEWLADVLEDAPLPSCISLGCGEGALERDLRTKSIVTSALGIDLSESILDIAREKAERDRLSNIDYRVGDMNRLDLPLATFVGAFFHHSLHHVADLESCLGAVHDSLVPGGLLYLDEYLGPSRREWRKPMLGRAQEVFAALPASVKRARRLRLPIDWRDPSEALRSSEILGVVRSLFEVTTIRPYGGNLLAVIYPYLDLTGVSQPERTSLLEGIIDAERSLLRGGAGSFCAVVVARKAPA